MEAQWRTCLDSSVTEPTMGVVKILVYDDVIGVLRLDAALSRTPISTFAPPRDSTTASGPGRPFESLRSIVTRT
jgi:hypothetical protein